MSEILSYLVGYGSLGMWFLMTVVAAMGLVGTPLVAPRLLLMCLLAVLAVFPNSASTAVAGEYGWNVYGKGQRFFYFSIYELMVIGMGCVVATQAWMRRDSQERVPVMATPEARWRNPYVPFYLVLALFVFGFALNDLVADRPTWLAQLGRNGVMTLISQGLFVSALVHLADNDARFFKGLKLFMLALGLVTLFGLVRYVALGGDPQGVYETEGASMLKITFWDINYLVLATGLGCWLLWEASTAAPRSGAWLWAVPGALVAFVVVALSARRSAQVGVLLALVGMFFALPKGRRLVVVLMLVLTGLAVSYKLTQRIDDNRPLITRLLQGDVRQQFLFDPRYDRYYELRLAWQTVKKHPLIGVGPAGEFSTPGHQGLEYHMGNYTFVHSGFGHVLLKTGFIGLGAFLGLLATYLLLLVREWRLADLPKRGALVFSSAGMLGLAPTLALGTPIIELRTALVMGLLMAIPLVLRRLRVAPVQEVQRLPVLRFKYAR